MTQPSPSICPRCGRQEAPFPLAAFCGGCGYPISYEQEKAHLDRVVDWLRLLCQSGGELLSIESLYMFSQKALRDLQLLLQQLNDRPDTIKDLLTIYTSLLQAPDPHTRQEKEWLCFMRDHLDRLCTSGGAELQVNSLLALPLPFANDLQLICGHNEADRPLIEQLQECEDRLKRLVSFHAPPPVASLPPPAPDSVVPEPITSGITKPWDTFFHDSFMMTATIAAFLILAATLLLTLLPANLFAIPTNTNPGALITIILISLALLLLAVRFKHLSTDQTHDYRLLALFYTLFSLSLAPALVIKISSQASAANWVVPLTTQRRDTRKIGHRGNEQKR
ncbi:MAG TPA: hypothetical protein VFV38_51135 [Ktedonobacteraceae bacterium]|nr:hypothetical protein [Ktedonobacteraceae bacterium]